MLMLPFFFLVGGLAQLFWVIPTKRNWGRTWDYRGMAGTIVFIAIWAITRIPGNPITDRGGPINQTAMIVEISNNFCYFIRCFSSKKEISIEC